MEPSHSWSCTTCDGRPCSVSAIARNLNLRHLSERFDKALTFASEVHREQTRKETDVPYVSHLLAVASLVLENEGSEDQAVAALLHDAPEDQGGEAMLAEIRSQFGDIVANLVVECSEPLELGKRNWPERKRLYLEHLADISDAAVTVVSADKLHNVRSINAELPDTGLVLFDRFGGGLDGSVWYYQGLAAALEPRAPTALGRDLTREVQHMAFLVERLRT